MYSLVTTFPVIFASLTIFGIDCIIIRDIAKDKEKAGPILFNAIIFQSVLIVFTSVIIVITMVLLGYNSKTMYLIFLFFLFSAVNSISVVNSSVFKAFEKMEYNAILNTGERLLLLIAGVTVVMNYDGVAPLLLTFLAVSLFKLIITFRLTFSKFAKLVFDIQKKIFGYFIKEGYPIAISSFFTAFRWNVIIVIIAKLLSDSDTGFYNAAFKIVYPLLIIIFAYSTAILPVFSVYYGKDDNNFFRLYRISCKFATSVSIPVAICITFFSSQIISLLFGEQFSVSADVLRIVIWILPFSFMIYPMGNILVAMNHQKMAMVANGVNSVVLFFLTLYLTSKYGLYGACASIVAAEFLLSLEYFYIVTIKYRYTKISEFLLKPAISGLLMFAVIYTMAENNLYLGAVSGLAVYSLSLYILKVFDREEIDKFRDALKINSIKND